MALLYMIDLAGRDNSNNAFAVFQFNELEGVHNARKEAGKYNKVNKEEYRDVQAIPQWFSCVEAVRNEQYTYDCEDKLS